MDWSLYLGVFLSIAAVAGLAVYSGTQARRPGGLSSSLVAGVILGTFLGGATTVGTAQLAYVYGLSAYWFCLGGAAGCLVLHLIFRRKFRSEGNRTVVGMIGAEYGPKARLAASALNCLGTFISILAQLLASTSVLAVVLPQLPFVWALSAAAALMIAYVAFGGTRGAGMVGLVKLALISGSMLACGALVLSHGGVSGFVSSVSDTGERLGMNFFSLLNRGAGRDIGGFLSVIFGVITSQIYIQAITAARSDSAAKKGLLVSIAVIPVIGLCSAMVGLYMRGAFPGIDPKTALTQFVLTQMPGLPGGIVLGTLFIAVVGSGAGLALGIATIIRNDILAFIWPGEGIDRSIPVLRILIVSLLAAAALVCACVENSMILSYTFLSMGFRGTVVFGPLIGALWFKDRVKKPWAFAAGLVGPAIVIGLRFVELPFDPLFAGLLASCALMAAGRRRGSAPTPARP